MNIQEITNRYIDKAIYVLTEKAVLDDGFYTNKKYVQMAGNTLWKGVILALNYKFPQIANEEGPADVDKYKVAVALENKKMLNHLLIGYNYMHLMMGYDGDLNCQTSSIAIEKARTIFDWAVNGKV